MLRYAVDSRRVVVGLALSAAGSLAFEISLTRIFAVQQFHSFAFVVVSLAVMGTAASGLALAVRGETPRLARLAMLGAAGMGTTYLVVNFVPFDSYVILWDPRQLVALLLYFVAAGLPFFFIGWATGACLAQAGEEAFLPYAANLGGAGVGCLVALGAHRIHGAEAGLGAAIGLTLAGAAAFAPGRWQTGALGLAGAAFVFLGFSPPAGLGLRLSPYKPLSVALLSPDAIRTITRYDAGQRLDAVESQSIRIYPGLSLNAPSPLPPQVALYIDGDGPVAITSTDPDSPAATDLARHLPVGLAYLLRPQASTLVVEPGGGLDALTALALGARRVHIAIDQPLVGEILEDRYRSFSRDLFAQPPVVVVHASPRAALRDIQDIDVVDFALSDPYRPVTAGAYSLRENYTLTVESLTQAFSILNEDGLLIITRWLATPPSEESKMFATVLAALERTGADDPRRQLLAFRGMRTATVVAGRRAFTASELGAVREFLRENGFDPIVSPGLLPEDLNRFNRLPEDTYHELFESLIADPKGAEGSYAFDIRPAVDNRPYFFHYFRWSQIPEVIREIGTSWEPFGGSGYLVLIFLLAIMTSLSLPLALLPRFLLVRKAGLGSRGPAVLGYFAALGAGYLLIEIPMIQQLTLLLDRPTIALAVVLFSLLSASGVGSLSSPRLEPRRSLAALVAVLLLTLLFLQAAIHTAMGWPFPLRVLVGISICLPAGYLMGVPFVAGLRSLSRDAPGFVAWAWAVNGAASGVSGVLAAMIGLTWGLRGAMLAGVLAYAVAAAAGRRLLRPGTGARLRASGT